MDGYRHTWNKAKRWPRWLAFALAAALVAVIALNSGGMSTADNVHGPVYDWARANPGQDVPVLVQTDGDSETVAQFIDSSGGTVQRELENIPAVEADISPDFVSTLAGHPDVTSISLAAPVVSTGGSGNDGGTSSQDAPVVSTGGTGNDGSQSSLDALVVSTGGSGNDGSQSVAKTTEDSLDPSLVPLHPPAVVVPPGLIAYVLGSPNSKELAEEVGLDLQAAGIRGASLNSVDWGAINWDAINWDAINWGAINWGAITWDAINWDAINWDAINWGAINWGAINWDAINWDAINLDALEWVSIKWGAIEEDSIEWADILE